MILALSGGVGGARLSNGLASILSPDDLVIITNTGDDFVHLGLRISPDLDTVMYTLAGRNNVENGWGLAAETWHFMEALGRIGGETWFRLGDQDLATHVERTRRIKSGETLSEVTSALCWAFGVKHRIGPMTDQVVRTILHTNEGTLSFQDYFVRRRCEPTIESISFLSDKYAEMSPLFVTSLSSKTLDALLICPSNPYLSIQPILSLAGVRSAIEQRSVPSVAISPIVGGAAIKGPAAKIIREMGHTPSSVEIARHYQGLIDGIIIDDRDKELAGSIEALGVAVCVTDTVMKSLADQRKLALTACRFSERLTPTAGLSIAR